MGCGHSPEGTPEGSTLGLGESRRFKELDSHTFAGTTNFSAFPSCHKGKGWS